MTPRQLVEKNLDLINIVVYGSLGDPHIQYMAEVWHLSPGQRREHFYSEAAQGLLTSAGSYDPTKASFRTYAHRRMKGRILDSLRYRKANILLPRLPLNLSGRTTDPDLWLDLKSVLDRKYYLLLRLVYVAGLTVAESAPVLGYTRGMTYVMHTTALRLARSHLS